MTDQFEIPGNPQMPSSQHTITPREPITDRWRKPGVWTAKSDLGRSLVGLVIVLGLLGVLGAAALISQTGSSKGQQPGQSPASTINASPRRAATDIQAAAAATCRADYGAVVSAASYYEVLNGKPPTTVAELTTVIKEPVSSTRFAITINPAHPGQVEVAAGGHAAAPGDGNCAYAD
jgi:hypothetical protein